EEGPLQFYQVYNAINKHADEDAIYSIDVGNSTQTSIRHLNLTPKNMCRTSPLFATMGIEIPGGIGAKNTYPDRHVWIIIGDGAFSMTYPEEVPNVPYNMTFIKVEVANPESAIIMNKYERTNKRVFGVDVTDV